MKKVYTRIAALAIMMMLVTMVTYGQKRIMFVGSAADYESIDNQSEIDIMDSLLTWGFEAEYVASATISAGGLDAIYPDYDGIVVSEWVGSSSVNNIGAPPEGSAWDAYELPVVCMEGYIHRDGRWNWITDNDNEFVHSSEDIGGTDNGNDVIIIKDNEHYITKPYEIDQEVTWSNAATNEAIDGTTVNSIGAMESLVTFTYPLATCKAHDDGFWNLVAVEGEFPNKVVVWGVIGTGLDGDQLEVYGGTDDFYNILKRSCQWAFDEMVGVEEQIAYKISGFDVKVYPNPARERMYVTYNSPVSAPVKANLYSITGQRVMTKNYQAVPGKNQFRFETENLAPGIYHLGLEINGSVEFEKLIVE